MTKEQYSSCDLNTRADLLWADGKILNTIDYYGYKVQLYSLYSFFVQLYYDSRENKIEKIECVTEDDLDKFINQINLSIS